MHGVNLALDDLHKVGLVPYLPGLALVLRHREVLQFRHGGLQLRRSHVGPHKPAGLAGGVGADTDLAGEVAVLRLRHHIYALAIHVILPAMVGAAEALFLVAAVEEAGVAVRAELLQYAHLAAGGAKSHHLLAVDLGLHGRAVRLGQLLREQHRRPEPPAELPHGRPFTRLTHQLVLFPGQHGEWFSFLFDSIRLVPFPFLGERVGPRTVSVPQPPRARRRP